MHRRLSGKFPVAILHFCCKSYEISRSSVNHSSLTVGGRVRSRSKYDPSFSFSFVADFAVRAVEYIFRCGLIAFDLLSSQSTSDSCGILRKKLLDCL